MVQLDLLKADLDSMILYLQLSYVTSIVCKTVKGLNPGVISKVGWVWSSGWS